MEKIRYSIFARIVYRYGNVIATLLLSVHLISSIIIMFHRWYFVFPALINLVVILWINKYFIKTYKMFPFEIEVDNEKIICRDFLIGKKEIMIKYEDIDELRGGIFSGYMTRPIYIHDARQNITIGFYSHVGNFQKLLTKILQNIPQKLYTEVTEKISSFRKVKK